MDMPTTSKTKRLDRFTACFAFVFNCEYNSLRGITDEKHKLLCIYAARRTFQIDDGVLSAYYRINVAYMRRKMEDAALALLMNEALADRIGNVRLYWELESDKE